MIILTHLCLVQSIYFFILFYFKYIFRVVLGSQQHWREDTEISHIAPTFTQAEPLLLSNSSTGDTFVEPTQHYHPKYLGVTLGDINSVAVDK